MELIMVFRCDVLNSKSIVLDANILIRAFLDCFISSGKRSKGLSPAQAIRIFYTQISMHHGLPFEVKIPNVTTREAIEELEFAHVFNI